MLCKVLPQRTWQVLSACREPLLLWFWLRPLVTVKELCLCQDIWVLVLLRIHVSSAALSESPHKPHFWLVDKVELIKRG